jgi:uncharacterized protein (UPF0335 family)
MTDTAAIPRQRICSFIERAERIEEEIKALNEGKKEVFFEAEGEDFDVKVLQEILRLRKQDKNERDEQESRLDLYLKAMENAASSSKGSVDPTGGASLRGATRTCIGSATPATAGRQSPIAGGLRLRKSRSAVADPRRLARRLRASRPTVRGWMRRCASSSQVWASARRGPRHTFLFRRQGVSRAIFVITRCLRSRRMSTAPGVVVCLTPRAA